ncbi:VTT domain-containing protein [Streptomyces profundus]|nr:VTT domain-containing protein [Streptomyces sp. MA3_2.13]
MSPWGRLLLLVLLVAGAWAAATLLGVDRLARAEPATLGSTVWAGPLFVALYALGTTAFVPKPALSAAAGALFGAGYGLSLTVAGTVLGALLGFAAGRFLGRDALGPMTRTRVLAGVERRLSERPFRGVLLARLLPVVPFAAVNLGAAVARVGWAPFAAATALGTLPGNAAWVLAGVSASTPATSWLWLPAVGCGALLGGAALCRAARRRRA